MDLLTNDLVLLGDGCEHLGYPSQLLRDGDQWFCELGEERDAGRWGGDDAGQRFGAEVSVRYGAFGAPKNAATQANSPPR